MMRPNSFMGNVHIQCPIQFKALISPSPGKPWAFNCAHGMRNLNLSRLGWGIEKEVPNLSSRIQALGWLGHLNTIFSPGQEGGGGNLNKPIFKSSVARGILKPLIFTSLLIHGKYFLMKTLFFQQSLDSFHHSPHATNGGDY